MKNTFYIFLFLLFGCGTLSNSSKGILKYRFICLDSSTFLRHNVYYIQEAGKKDTLKLFSLKIQDTICAKPIRLNKKYPIRLKTLDLLPIFGSSDENYLPYIGKGAVIINGNTEVRIKKDEYIYSSPDIYNTCLK